MPKYLLLLGSCFFPQLLLYIIHLMQQLFQILCVHCCLNFDLDKVCDKVFTLEKFRVLF